MNTLEIIVASVMAAALLWQIFYWSFFMFRVRKRPRNLGPALPDVSIIICARNEQSSIGRLVEALVAQKYAAQKQIVIVDDCSTDDTPLVIARLRAQYPEVYTTTIPGDSKFKHGKKLALTVGIKAAAFEHMVFIDADCLPASDHWLTRIAEKYADPDCQMVLGYGRYAKRSGLLNLLIRYETFWNAVQYFGFSAALRPFMGVGRNLSYTKKLFDQSSKFRKNINILSGDDDMFVSEMGTRRNTSNVFCAEAHTVSEPKPTWLTYSAQKSRHLTTASLYPASVKFWLVSELASRTIYWLALAAMLVSGFGLLQSLGLAPQNDLMLYAAATALGVRTLLMYVSLGLSAHNMGESKMWILALPFDVMVPCMQAAAWLTGTATQSRNTWK